MTAFDGVQVSSATMIRDREVRGDRVTSWLAAHATRQLVDLVVTQSSDAAYHCITVTVFYRLLAGARR
jgi:hypothetical protein